MKGIAIYGGKSVSIHNNNNNNNNNNNKLQLGSRPVAVHYITCKENMKLVKDNFRFKSGGLHEKHVVATWNVGSHLSICL